MKKRIKDTVSVRANRYIIEIFWKSSMMVSGLNTRTQDGTLKQECPELASPISKKRRQADLSKVSAEDP